MWRAGIWGCDSVFVRALPLLWPKILLLQFLQAGTFSRIGGREELHINARIICTGDLSLESDLEQGTFREDLFFRISGASVPLPQLRERIEDLPCIADYLLNQFAESFRIPVRPLSKDLNQRLHNYHWPGNMRELENVHRRYALLGTPVAILEGLSRTQPRLL